MRSRIIWVIIILIVLFGILYAGGYIGNSTTTDNAQPPPHAIDQSAP